MKSSVTNVPTTSDTRFEYGCRSIIRLQLYHIEPNNASMSVLS